VPNAGLDIAGRLLEPITEQFPILSYVDFYQTMQSAGKKRCRTPLSRVPDMTATGIY